MSVPALLVALRAWVPRCPDILAAALVGSYARSAATDESDVDLMLLTDASAAYVVDTEWAASFGDVRTAQVEFWGSLTTLRVWYRNDLEVEFNVRRVARTPSRFSARRIRTCRNRCCPLQKQRPDASMRPGAACAG